MTTRELILKLIRDCELDAEVMVFGCDPEEAAFLWEETQHRPDRVTALVVTNDMNLTWVIDSNDFHKFRSEAKDE